MIRPKPDKPSKRGARFAWNRRNLGGVIRWQFIRGGKVKAEVSLGVSAQSCVAADALWGKRCYLRSVQT